MFKFCNMLGTLVSEIPFTRCLKIHSSAVARIEGTPPCTQFLSRSENNHSSFTRRSCDVSENFQYNISVRAGWLQAWNITGQETVVLLMEVTTPHGHRNAVVRHRLNILRIFSLLSVKLKTNKKINCCKFAEWRQCSKAWTGTQIVGTRIFLVVERWNEGISIVYRVQGQVNKHSTEVKTFTLSTISEFLRI